MSSAELPPHAQRTSWNTKALGPMEPFPYAASFSPDQYETIRRGLIPEVMEDKWFIYWEDHALFFHRSWTGHGIYRVRFRVAGDRFEVAEATVATGVDYYRRTSDEDEAALVDFLIRGLLLGESVEFPVPAEVEGMADLYQHHVAGTAFSECVLKSSESGWIARLKRWLRLPADPRGFC
jgi:hypothetical protein